MDNWFSLCQIEELKIIYFGSTKIIIGIFCIIGTIITTPAFSQDNQLWTDYNLTVPVPSTNKFTYGGDAGWRRGGDTGIQGFISTADFNQIIVRPTARYRFSQMINVGGGVAGFFTFNNGAENIYEFRIQEEVNVRWPDLSFLALFYRVRFDQRFFYVDNGPNEQTGRVRYLVGMESEDYRLGEGRRPFFFEFFLEGFKTLGRFSIEDTFVNQIRWTGIFGHRITGLIRYEIHYINQQQRGELDSTFETTQHILRLRLFHRIELKEN